MTVIMRSRKYDRLQVRIVADRSAAGAAAAAGVAGLIRQVLSRQETVNMVFAAAPSQVEFLAALVARDDIRWSRINAFHMDEYIGLSPGSEQRFSWFLQQHLFHLRPFHAVHLLDPDRSDIQEACARYAALLKDNPPDIVCMGIGENGHIAFNDPEVADFNDDKLVKVVTLDPACRIQQVNDRCFKELPDVPRQAVTMTVPALLAAKYISAVVPGRRKAAAVRHCLEGEVTEKWPASILRTHPDAVLFLDRESSSLLKF